MLPVSNAAPLAPVLVVIEPKFAGTMPPPLLEVTPLPSSRDTVDCGCSPAQAVSSVAIPNASSPARIGVLLETFIATLLRRESGGPALAGRGASSKRDRSVLVRLDVP